MTETINKDLAKLEATHGENTPESTALVRSNHIKVVEAASAGDAAPLAADLKKSLTGENGDPNVDPHSLLARILRLEKRI